MSYEIIDMPARKVMGYGCRTTNQNGRGMKDIGQIWAGLGDFISKNAANATNDLLYGVYSNYESDFQGKYDFTLAVELRENKVLEKEYRWLDLPAGKYARFSAEGDPAEMAAKLWGEIWATSLERLYLVDYEIYSSLENVASGKKLDIYIGIA